MWLATALGSASFFATPVWAQTDPQASDQPQATNEIIVTAQRREERLQDVPISIQSLDAQALKNANVQDLTQVAKLTPALRFDNQGPFVQGTIRGIGSAIVTSGAGSNVGIYVDGFYSPNPIASDFQLLNVESVQVLKGPQGTLFGRNTTGGAILVTTAKPKSDPAATLDVSYGSFNAFRAQGYATAGIGENVAFDVGAEYASGDGFIHNIVTGSDKDGKYKNWTVRAGLKVDFSPDVSLLLRYQHQDHNDPYPQNVGVAVIDGQPITQSAFFPGAVIATKPGDISFTDKVAATAVNNIYQMTLSADLGFAKLDSYTQYRDEKSVFQQSFNSATPNFIVGRVPIHDKTFTQELLLNSRAGGRLQWTAGVFYLDYEDTFQAFLTVPGPASFQAAGSHSDTRSLAFYANATYELVDKLFLTAGARYSRDQIRNPYYQSYLDGLERHYAPVMKTNRLTPRVVLRYQMTPDSNVYASFTKGYKGGLYNLGGASTDPIKPETLTAYELGFKHVRGALSFDLAGFYYDYKDLQVSSYGITNGVPVGYIRNAASARIYGIEGQARYNISHDFSVGASAGWLHARYRHFYGDPYYTSCFTDSAPAECFPEGGLPNALVAVPLTDAAGYHMQRAPDFTASFNALYGFDLGGGRAELSGNVYYTSKFYFDSAQQIAQDGYATMGLRAQWTDPSDRFTFAVFGDNLTDKRYLTQALLQNNAAPVSWSPPATWGVEVRAKLP
jgi:iron complex outermembrane receptor protein